MENGERKMIGGMKMENDFKKGLKIDIMQFNTKKRKNELDVMQFQTKQPKKEVHQISKSKTRRKVNFKRLVELELGAIIAAGAAFGGISHWKNSQSVTLEEAKEAGKTVEQLKITPEQDVKLQQIKQIVDKDTATDYELLTSLQNIEELNIDMQKTKIAKTMGKDKESVSLFTGINTASEGETKEVITIDGIKYENFDMSKQTSEAIKDLGKIQSENYKAQNGDIKGAELKSKVKRYLDITSKMAASEMEEENGKIEMKPTTKGEVKKLKEEQQKQREDGPEI